MALPRYYPALDRPAGLSWSTPLVLELVVTFGFSQMKSPDAIFFLDLAGLRLIMLGSP